MDREDIIYFMVIRLIRTPRFVCLKMAKFDHGTKEGYVLFLDVMIKYGHVYDIVGYMELS